MNDESVILPERPQPTRWDRWRASLGMAVIGHGWARWDLVQAHQRGPHCKRCHVPIDTLDGDYVYARHDQVNDPDDPLPIIHAEFLCGPCRMDKPLSLAAKLRVRGNNRFLRKLERKGLRA